MPAPEQEPKSFVEILERVWWRLDRALDEASLRASARLYVAEALLAGTTTLIDHHESPSFIAGSLDVLAGACDELGVRALLCYGATERNGGRAEASQGLAECRRFARENRRRGVRGAVGLHASFTVSDDTIREAGALCREIGAVLHVHVAEDAEDVEDAKQRGYEGPVERLIACGALVPGSILAHGVHLDRAQVSRAADSGCWFVQNPRSNENNEVGYARALAAAGLRVALGTDGFPARMEDEVQAGLRLCRAEGEPESLPAQRLQAGLRMVEELFGAPPGDEVVVEAGRVMQVTIDGREVVRGGRLVSADIAEIRRDAEREAERLWGRMKGL
jgi:cytosine/adenosine deaminase-related metal-dependent hydrolase